MRWSPPASPWWWCCITGRALAVPALVEQSGALVHAFFPGIEGGHALADVLFGDYNPGGKEPVTWPRSVGQLPIHHYDPPNGRPNIPERGDYKAHWLDESDEPLVRVRLRPVVHALRRSSALELPAAHRPRGHADGARAPDEPRQPCRRRSAAALHPAARRARGDRQATAGIPARASGGGRVARHRVHDCREESRGARRAGSMGIGARHLGGAGRHGFGARCRPRPSRSTPRKR